MSGACEEILFRIALLLRKCEDLPDAVLMMNNISRERIETLRDKIRDIRHMLDKAEVITVGGFFNDQMDVLVEDVKDAMYALGDRVDEWEKFIVELERGKSYASGSSNKISSFIQSLSSRFKIFNRSPGLVNNFERLIRSLDIIVQRSRVLLGSQHYERVDEIVPYIRELWASPHSRSGIYESSSFNPSGLRNRDDYKNDLVSTLLTEGRQQEIVTIVGESGIGKTSLARQVFCDMRVEKHFLKRVWINMSTPYPALTELEQFLKSKQSSSSSSSSSSISALVKRRILLVLDDVGEADEHRWMPLISRLKKRAAYGCRVLVTTRDANVAEKVGTHATIFLGPLSDFDCFTLLSETAQLNHKKNPDKLRPIAEEIARRCDGSPFAANILGKLLGLKDEVSEWQSVLYNEIWKIYFPEVKCFQHIYMCYNDLKPQVKDCFRYCAIFSNGSEIDVGRLIRMWMAQGFLSSSYPYDMEQQGRAYFSELEKHSFFEEIKVDEFGGHVVSCKMNHLVHDFTRSLTRDELFIAKTETQMADWYPSVRHLARHYMEEPLRTNAGFQFETLRTFLSEGFLQPQAFSSLICVRVLSLFNSNLLNLPPKIGSPHLRYLDLRDNPIVQLPTSLCDFFYLQTLDVGGCKYLRELPEEIYKLENLRHLLCDMCSSLKFPQGLEELTGLKTLNHFHAGRGSNELRRLGPLNKLEGFLIIDLSGLDEDTDVDQARAAKLKDKEHIKALKLRFSGTVGMDVIEALEAPPYLRRLELDGFNGIQFPKWLNHTSLFLLKSLEIRNVGTCSTLPELGKLPSLEKLYIWRVQKMESLSREFLGITEKSDEADPSAGAVGFEKLRTLRISSCELWTNWKDLSDEEENVVSVMPELLELIVLHCPKLKSLPYRLLRKTKLEYLEISGSDLVVAQYQSGIEDELLSPSRIIL